MIKKQLINSILLLFVVCKINAQQAFTSSGGTATGTNGSLSYTIGDWAYTANTGTTGSISQGVQQAFVTSTSNGVPTSTTTCWRSIGDGASNSVFAITSDGKLYAWGYNNVKQLGIGNGSTSNVNVPTQIGTDSNWQAVSASTTHALALKTDGTLWVCGVSASGGLGLGNTTTTVTTFTQIGTSTDWKTITTGPNISAAIKNDGTLWTWGINTSGQMGDGTTVNKFVPTQIGTDTNWKLVSGGSASGNIFALKNNGTLWFAGPNSYFHSGNSALNALSVTTSFTQIGTDTDWVHAQSGYNTAMAKKANGTYYLWGANGYGQIGNGTTASVLTPTALSDNGSPWVNVYLGVYQTYGLKADSTLWAWGTNQYGSYGNGTTVTPAGNVPVQVQSGVNYTKLAGGLHVLAIKDDGSLWLWGFNTSGQVGNGTFTNQLTPIASTITTPCTTVSNSPTITSFTPTTGTTGTTVTLTGTNFTGATAVSFGGTAATSFTVVNSTTITAVIGSGTTGSVSVTTPGGNVSASGFTFCSTAAPTASAQSFCGAGTVADLVATGTAIQWYSAATGGTALATTTALATGTYYASQTETGCESARTSVSITVNQVPTAPTASAQSFCGTATVADLVATGTAIKWYDAATGGTELATTTALATGTYYVSQTDNGCESARTSVSVTVNAIPAAPTASSYQVYTGTSTVGNLVATGTAIQWYAAATGGTALPATTEVTSNTLRYASQTVNGCESTRTAVLPIKISNASQTFCSGIGPRVNLLASTPSSGATAQWFTTATGGTALAGITTLNTDTYYVEQKNPALTTALIYGTNLINLIAVAVESDGKILYASLGQPTIKRMNADGSNSVNLGSGFTSPSGIAVQADGKIVVIDAVNGLIKRMDADGTNIVTLGTGFSNPSGVAIQSDGKILVSDAGNSTIKRMDADGSNIVTLGTGFNGPYGVAIQSDGKIVVADLYNNAIKRMDADGSNIVTLATGFNQPFGVAIQSDGKIVVSDKDNNVIKRMNADGSNLVTLASGFNTPRGVAIQSDGKILVAVLNDYAIKQISDGGSSNRVAVSVTINPSPAAPTASAQSFCGTATVADLVATGTAIKWYAGNGGRVPVLASTTALATGTYYASQTETGCESARTSVSITVNPVPTAPTASAQSFCGTATVADLVATGTAIQWYSAATGGTALATTDALATGTYYASQTVSGCESARTSVSITVNEIPTAPTASAQSICGTATVADLVATGTAIQWYSAATGGTALATTDALATGNYYVSQTVNNCESTRTSVSVTVNSTPAFSNTTATNATVGTAYSLNAGVTGNSQTVVYSVSPALATGLTLNTATGLISGTPTAVTASTTYTVTATQGTCEVTQSYTFSVGCSSMTYTTSSLPKRDYNQFYSQTVAVSGNTSALTYTISSGTVPAGFTLSSTGVISGTSTSVGTFTFTVLATDANGCTVSKTYSIGLNQIPITVTATATTKEFGTADPALTYTIVPALQTGDSFTGSLSRTQGEDAGTYQILEGTLSAGPSYIITYVGANFTITPAAQTITWTQNIVAGCDGSSTVELTATSSSGLPVSYTSGNTAIATINGVNLQIVGRGTVNVTATQAGSTNYLPATNVVLPVVVSQPNLIVKQFSDIIFFDNSSNSYSNYQWFKDGVAVAGATKQYFKENGNLKGTYHATALRNGALITTCVLVLNETNPEFYIKVYPNPVVIGNTFEAETTLATSSLIGAKIQLYTSSGVLVSETNVNSAKTTVNAPNTQGIYIVRLLLSNGTVHSVNVLVK